MSSIESIYSVQESVHSVDLVLVSQFDVWIARKPLYCLYIC
jgi:hypothetical protein